MGALFCNLAVLHHEDAVGVTDGREPVRHDEGGAPLHQTCECILNLDFGSGVDGRGRLIENEHRRFHEHDPRYAEQLPFALGEAVVVADDRVIAVFQTLYEAVCARRFCGRDDLFIGRVSLAERDVLPNRAVLYPGVLEHHAEVAAQAAARDAVYVLAVHLDAAAIHVIEAQQQVYQRCFAAARRADNGYRLAGGRKEVKAVDERPALII